MNVEIKGEQLKFEIGSIWGVVYDFETLTAGSIPFDLSKTIAVHIAMYGVLLRSNPGMTLTMEQFVEELNNITLAKALTTYFVKRMEVLSQGEEVEKAVEGANPNHNDNPNPNEPKKKEESRSTTQPMRCTGNVSGVMGWIRRIFSALWVSWRLETTSKARGGESAKHTTA